MQFEMRFARPIATGAITLTYRRWKRCQVVAGHRYRTSAGRIEVESVDVVAESAISPAEARRAGYPSTNELLAGLRDASDLPLYRVQFHHVDEPDPRDELAATMALGPPDLASIDERLARLDRASSHGPWTATTLGLIATRPGVRAGDLAAAMGRDKEPFKVDVRKLKNLGLTLSLDVGYQLSPRGEAYVSARRPITRPG